MNKAVPEINLNVLTWAALRSGLSGSDLAHIYPQYNKWLTREIRPTFNQLQKVSMRLHFPLGYFFMNKIPDEKQIIPLFRSTNGADARFDFNISDMIKIVQDRQKWASEYMKDCGSAYM